MKKIAGQIIALTKSIFLTEPKSECGYMAQFMVGKRDKFSFCGGIGLSWWYTKASFKGIEVVASMLVKSKPEFTHCDLESVEQMIQDTLGEVCIDKRIFDPDMVCLGRKQTLFECKQPINANDFADIILAEMAANLRNTISRRCTVYVAPRVCGSTFSLESQDLSIIAKSDESAWKALLAKGYQTNGWCPSTGDYSASNKTAFSWLKYDYVFACEEIGTQKGCKFSSQLKLRRLFSVIFAITSEQNGHSLAKSAATPYTPCLQFPEATAKEATITMSEIGALVPYYVSDHFLSDTDISSIRKWFNAAYRLKQDSLGRIEKCAHYINRAMNSDDIEAYVNYYVALDALFGERGSVELSILNGVKELQIETPMEEKAPWLFDLRNELVHGGSRYIKEWPKYQRYYRHFDTRPEEDIEKLAFAALNRAPKILA